MGFICLAGFLVLVGACMFAYAGEGLGEEEWRNGICLSVFVLLVGVCLYTYACTGSLGATVVQLECWLDNAKVFATCLLAVLVVADVVLKTLKATVTSANINSIRNGTNNPNATAK